MRVIDHDGPLPTSETVKPGVQRRLEFIDFRLFWNGRFNRRDLSEAFQLSPQQASADIGTYERMAPGNLRYDAAQKAYVRSDAFAPLYMGELTDRYLLQLVGIKTGAIRQDDTWFENPPPSDIVGLRRRPTDPRILLAVLDAMREKREVLVEYRSIHSAENSMRWIAPHGIAHSAGRWHVRAWARDRNDFRDFNLNRITAVVQSRPVTLDYSLDYEWHSFVDLILQPNPMLTPETRDAVAADYEMTDGRIVESVRLSLVFYLINDLNLDVEPGVLKEHKQQLVLDNRAEVEMARSIARKMSADALRRHPVA